MQKHQVNTYFISQTVFFGVSCDVQCLTGITAHVRIQWLIVGCNTNIISVNERQR